MAQDTQRGGDDERPRRTPSAGAPQRNTGDPRRNSGFAGPGSGDRRAAPRSGGPDRARRSQPQGGEDPRSDKNAPPIPPDVEAKQLAPDVRGELMTLDKATADYVAKHLVAAGNLLEEDPELALRHAQAARTRSGRIAAVREAVGIAAYHCGDWAQALSELRAARRMGSKSPLLALIADCERGVGRPQRAVDLSQTPEAQELSGDDADELRIVVAGARSDLGQPEKALAVLSNPPLDPERIGLTATRLFYAYADTLLALGRNDEALQWFIHAETADVDGVTDADERITELS